MKDIEWSEYSKAIFNDILNGQGHSVIVARAGSGKTTTLVEGVKYIPKSVRKSLFCAFNKRIQQELDERISKSYIECRTLHSRGFEAIKNGFGQKIALDPNKTMNLSLQYLKTKLKVKEEPYALAFAMTKAIGLCKGMLIDTPSKIDVMMDDFNIDTFDMDRDEFIKGVCRVLRTCKENYTVIDFNEMVWLPFVYNLGYDKYGIVCIDEVNDLNAAQFHTAISSCADDGRIIAAGDPEQILYAFTGVDIDSFDKLIKRLKAKTFTLPVSYRCAKRIVELAQKYVPDIMPAPNAKDGLIEETKESRLSENVRPGDFVLCRYNAPLVKHCMEFIRNGIPANIHGKDIGAGLKFLIKKSKKKSLKEFDKWLGEWKDNECLRLSSKNRDASVVLDKYECLTNLMEGAKTLTDVEDNIANLFDDKGDKDMVICSSIHGAKGLERERVHLLIDHCKPNKSKSELNITYVGITRAKSELYLVHKN